MTDSVFNSIFQKYSKTYYYSSLLFPPGIRDDVAKLYAFVRLPDEYVDNPVSEPAAALDGYRRSFLSALGGSNVEHPVIDGFVELLHRKKMPIEWPLDFLDAMAMDLSISRYRTFAELRSYTFGSAETVGLMMSKIMGVEERYYSQARLLGLSMQLTNFVRDIGEDAGRGRIYIPLEDLQQFGIDEAEWGPDVDPDRFRRLLELEIDRIRGIQVSAEEGFAGISKDYLGAVKTASDLYLDVLGQIEADPMIVWKRSLKPSLRRIATVAGSALLDKLRINPGLAAARSLPR